MYMAGNSICAVSFAYIYNVQCYTTAHCLVGTYAERLFGPEVFTEAVSGFESGDSLLGYSPLG